MGQPIYADHRSTDTRRRGDINTMKPTCLLVILLVLWLSVPGLTVEDEYVVKSLLIEKISLFVNWPEQSGINDPSKPFIIGLIGEDHLCAVIFVIYPIIPGQDTVTNFKRNQGHACFNR
jgi:hypothetical protein